MYTDYKLENNNNPDCLQVVLARYIVKRKYKQKSEGNPEEEEYIYIRVYLHNIYFSKTLFSRN